LRAGTKIRLTCQAAGICWLSSSFSEKIVSPKVSLSDNELDRYHLAIEVIERVPRLAETAAHIKQQFRDSLIAHSRYVREHGEDMPQIRDWVLRPSGLSSEIPA
jgi:XFP C-terminal domain